MFLGGELVVLLWVIIDANFCKCKKMQKIKAQNFKLGWSADPLTPGHWTMSNGHCQLICRCVCRYVDFSGWDHNVLYTLPHLEIHPIHFKKHHGAASVYWRHYSEIYVPMLDIMQDDNDDAEQDDQDKSHSWGWCMGPATLWGHTSHSL